MTLIPAVLAVTSSQDSNAVPIPRRRCDGLTAKQEELRLVVAVFHDRKPGDHAAVANHGDVGVAVVDAAPHSLRRPGPSQTLLDAVAGQHRDCVGVGPHGETDFTRGEHYGYGLTKSL